MKSSTLLHAAAALALATASISLGADFTVITTQPVSTIALPTTPFPIAHWDLRKFDNCDIPYAVNNAGAANLGYAATRNLVDSAFLQWTSVTPNKIKWHNSAFGAGTASVGVANDRINAVSWDTNLCSGDPWDPALRGGAVAIAVINAVIAPGSVGIGATATGEIIEGDIVFDDNNFIWTNGNQNAGNLFTGDDVHALEPVPGGGTRQVIQAGPNLRCDTIAICTDIQVVPFGGATANANDVVVRAPGPAGSNLTGTLANYNGFFDVWAICAHETGHIHGLGENNLNTSNGNVLETRGSGLFAIPAGTTFSFTVNGNVVNVALTAGPNRTAAQIVAEINAAIAAQQPGSAAATVSSAGGVVITATNPAHLIIVTGDANALSGLGLSAESAIPTMRQATLRGATSLDQRTLERADRDSVNFLYTADMGDAPDNKVNGNPTNTYQTYVHSQNNIAGAAGQLNGEQLHQPALGPTHLFGTPGYRWEWLGPDEDGPFFECEALVPNLDSYDDGVALPSPMKKGFVNRVTVFVSYANVPGRYAQGANDDVYLNGAGVGCGGTYAVGATLVQIIGPGPNGVLDSVPNNCNPLGNDTVVANRITTGPDNVISTQIPNLGGQQNAGARQLHMNGYFDFNGNNLFDAAERTVWWSGIPGATGAASANFVPGASVLGTNPMALVFDVAVPANVPDNFYSRFRIDYGENEGRVRATDPSLGPAVGVAQFGEVEDHPCVASNSSGQADQLHLYGPYPGVVQPGIPCSIDASVQIGFNPIPNVPVHAVLVQGSGQFTTGSPGISDTTVVTNVNGIASIGFEPQATGQFIIKVELIGTPLETYAVFNTSTLARAGDVNGDCAVNTADLTLLLSTFGGPHAPEQNVDFNLDGQTTTTDLTILLSRFGQGCTPAGQ